VGAVREYKLSNGNIGLEITYGGKESPFGGVDTSAPPAYIAPNCFAAADGFLVIDNKLVAASLQPVTVPATLWGNVVGVKLLAFGTFYQTGYGQLNYALGYTAQSFPAPPSTDPTGVNYTFYMTTWQPQNPAVALSNTEFNVTLFDSFTPATQATITLDCIGTGAQSNPATSGATVNILTVHDFPPTFGWINSNSDLTISGGQGYTPGQFITIVQGSNWGAVVQVLTTGIGGSILTWNLTGPASGYTVGPASVLSYIVTPTILTIDGPAGPNTYSVASSTYTNLTRQAVVTAMVAAINAGPDPNVVAAASPDGYAIVLTAINPGAVGNTITVTDTSTDYTGVLPPVFYFACRITDNLSGGQDLVSVLAPRFFTTASVADVGGTLYFGNIGPMILKYTEPAIFKSSTLYNGVGVLRKFAGSLLGLRLKPQLSILVQNTDMIMAWSAAEDLDEWVPVSTDGFVTGAGFEQIADIGDYLAGLVVSNGTAFIIRSQGISYATPTGNAALPFTVAHIGLGDKGEGSQLPNLICQYDQTGVFVGASDVYQLSGSISAIGQKIKAALFQDLLSVAALGSDNLVNAAAGTVFIGGDEFPLVVLGISTFYNYVALKSYIYNAANGTWMPFTYKNGVGISSIQSTLVSLFASLGTGPEDEVYNQSLMSYGFQQQLSGTALPPKFFSLQEGVPNTNSISNQAGIAFPVEEILFGRDITYDSLYLSLWAKVTDHTFVDFYNNGILYATLDLDPVTWNTLSGNPKEVQLFPLSTYGAGAVTGKSPQLTYKVRSLTDTTNSYIRFSKLTLFGSFDPMQRPT
jgi:hypothetical protein